MSVTLDLKLHGGKKVLSLDTNALQIKNTAATAFLEIAKAMKQKFFKYVEKTFAVSKKYITYHYST